MSDENIKRCVMIRLWGVRFLAWCILCFERIWPRLLPFFLALSFLCSLSWFGIFNVLPYGWHLFFLSLILFVAVGSLFLLAGFRFPTAKEVDRHIEQKSGLKNQPLSVQTDRLCSEDDKDFSAVIWREHQRRMAEDLRYVRSGFAYPNSANHDPMALRFVFVLLCVCAFSFSFGSLGGRLQDAFDLRSMVNESSMRVDAWVTPPSYTGVAPIYLTRSEMTNFSIPEGSEVVIRVVDGFGVTVKAISEEDGRKVLLSQKREKTALNDSIVRFETRLERSMNLSFSSRYQQQQWHLDMMKDQIPTIRWLEKPERISAGALELQYEMDDDYGVTNAFAAIESLVDFDKNAVPLYQAPQIKLLLARGGKGKMRMVQDLSSHPWAGTEVKITLVVEDGAGQKGRSKTFVMTLPQRVFANPVARAVNEQRRLLALNAAARERVLDMLAALLVRPENGIQNSINILALQSAWTRLSMAQTEDELRDVVHYLWQIAIAIEGDQSESAQQRLKQAQTALRDALRRGASGAEIERLMADLRQAMHDYIRALAEKAPENSDSNNKANLSEDSLHKKLDSIEQMAQIGSSSSAEQLLDEIEQTLDHLRVQKSNRDQEQKNTQTTKMKKTIDKLGDVMRRQQEILNDTHRLETEKRRGETVTQEQSEALVERQAQLQSELSVLEKELSEQGFEKGGVLKEAEEKMNSAKAALGYGNHETSVKNQSDVLESLRQGAQNILQKMREALKQSEDMQNAAESQDPLGRPLPSDSDQGQDGKTMSQEGDKAQARQILEEIRRRLNKDHLSEEEKNYLERLLHFH
ncbi:TIGR02302 family protein [Bartonella bacilliformis]|uniref:TIGR02302 family protein n=1 Tax=Bartonella bacilliformis TaxID=774 RepID=UPI00044BFBC4|nr:TIGR02302 family protein [Bartonella bacilliformis]EYS95511.1 TIGR02302 family protein [Bartonella bacilliformis Peru-18]KEG18412.1 TIGR02302 family protein [Bartonella bacilliformis CUSCO5]KZM38209.1 hypothetical protein AWH67_00875 [Bartonella bacilliformis]